MRKLGAVFVLLIFLSVVLVRSDVELVHAESTIYIRADGTVEGTDKIMRDGKVYTLTDDIYNSTITVMKDDVVLDGNGHVVQARSNGVVLSHRNNVTVQNFTITTSSTSDNIYVRYCTNCTIQNNILTRFVDQYPNTGVSVWGGGFNVIAENQITNNSCGIFLGEATRNNSIVGNSITNNTRGMHIQRSQNNSIYSNNFNNKLSEVQILAGPAGTTLAIQFDNGTSGNHWNNYKGTDPDGNGVGNTPYFIEDTHVYLDIYPLMNPVQVKAVQQSSTIPEFPTTNVLALILVATLVVVVYMKRIKKFE